MSNVSGVIKSIQDIMRKDAGIDGDAQRIGQLVWMFFLKILDDQEESLMLLSDDYKSPIPKHLRWSSWARDPEGITGDALLDFVNNQLFPKLKKLPIEGEERDRAIVIRTAFEDAYNYMKNGTLIRQVVNKINEIDFNSTGDKHAFGDVYEQILKDLQSAGNAGEFYTPRAVTQFMVDMLDPKLDEMVLDPACGTGGFLAHVMDHKSDHYVQSTGDAETVQKSIFGVEKKALPHLLCVTNMMLHGIEAPTNIAHDNTLSTPLKDHKWRGKVDVIVSNPPFGGMEEDGIEKNVPQAFQTRETADLFLVLIIELLKEGGRAAVVLPDGTLFGEGIKTRIKEKLMTECNLHTIVRLPNGVFNPYTGIKTNLLFFEKCELDGDKKPKNPTTEVWFYEHPYPEGYKSYSKTKPMRIEEFEGEGSEKAWWGELKTRLGRMENARAWKVSAEEIKANGFNLDVTNPNRNVEGPKDPTALFAAWKENLEAITATQSQLKSALTEALANPMVNQNHAGAFLEEFALLTKGSGGVQKLRELVLQLAVRGRLSNALPSDDKIDDFICAIPDEIEKHITSGKGKKRREIEFDTKEPSFDIPRTWRWLRLDQLASYIQRGKSPTYADDGQIKIISQKCVQWSGFSDTPCRFLDDDAFSKFGPERLVQTGDLLWNSTGTGTIGRVNVFDSKSFDDQQFVADSHVTVVRLASCDPRYVWCFLASPDIQRTLESDASGSTNQVELSAAYVRNTWIPLPPLSEQKRIVSKVDGLMALCNQMEDQVHEGERLNAELMASLVHTLTKTDPDGGGDAKPVDQSEETTSIEGSEQASRIAPETPETKSVLPSVNPKLEAQVAPARVLSVDTKFQEAVLVAAITKTFFQAGGEPIGNFRLQKAVYFARRKMGQHVDEMAYLRKAAGPYNPSMKYSGGIAIAKQKNWLHEARGRFGFGHVPGADVGDAGEWIDTYGYAAPARWVAEHFRYKKNEEWETLATVDYAIEHLQAHGIEPDAAQILQYIGSDSEWRPKIEKLGLTEMSVGTAMLEVQALFSAQGEGGSA